MLMETSAGQLHAALKMFAGLIEGRVTTPVLGSVMFDGDSLTGTDCDMEATVKVGTIGKAKGSSVIDYRRLSALVRSLPADETVTLGEDDRLASLTFNGSTYRMPAYAVSDFPTFRSFEAAPHTTDNLGFVAAMKRVRFAVSTEEARYYLNGVAMVKDSGGNMWVCATNGHQLAMLPVAGMPEAWAGAILPRRMVDWLIRRGVEPSSVAISADGLNARVELPGATLRAKLIDGSYPDIWRVVPSDTTTVFAVDRQKFLTVLRRMDDFVSGSMSAVRLSVESAGLVVSMAEAGVAAAEERLDIQDAPTKPVVVGFNVQLLIAHLRMLQGDVAIFSCDGPTCSAPMTITCDGDPLRLLLMPMRI